MWSKKNALLLLIIVIVLGFFIPEAKVIPVKQATTADWNHNTFWYEPWGSSGVHKGIDIFGAKNTPVIASSHQVILYRGEFNKGGKVILALGPKWRLHYYAHLAEFDKSNGRLVAQGQTIALLGDTGNAKNKPPHVHYSIISLLPLIWKIDDSTQGYKKAFYLNPDSYLREGR